MTMFLGIKGGHIMAAERDRKQVEDAEIIYGFKFDEIQEIDEEEQPVDYIQGYDGYFYLKGTEPSVPLSELKLVKRDEINAARDQAEQGGFEYMGKVFDSDPISCQRMSCAAQAMQAMSISEGQPEPTITWTTQDNSTIDLTPAELMGLVGALAAWSNQCHQKATVLKKQIDEAGSEDELNKIVWE